MSTKVWKKLIISNVIQFFSPNITDGSIQEKKLLLHHNFHYLYPFSFTLTSINGIWALTPKTNQ